MRPICSDQANRDHQQHVFHCGFRLEAPMVVHKKGCAYPEHRKKEKTEPRSEISVTGVVYESPKS